MSANESNRVPVLVTTDKRGVFYGYLPEYPASISGEIALADARNCLYWTTDTKGVFGLAAHGPGDGCRVGPKVPELRLAGVTSVARCTPEAAERWEAGPWGR